MDSDGELDIVELAERTALQEDAENDAGDEENDENQEVQREVNEDEVEEVEADGNEDDDTARRVIKPKRVVRNPQPKLNADTLRGPRGLTALPTLFAKQKFKGKGHEEADLNVILKTYEYWCHRLYPKMRFDQCIEKIESLGNKKPVMTYIKRIRMGLLDEEPVEPRVTAVSDDENETAATPQQQQHIESVEARFDSFAQVQKEPELTEEQKQIIRENKERAMKLRAERLRRIQEQAETKLGVSSVLPSQQDEESVSISTIEQEIHDKTTQIIDDQVDGGNADVCDNHHDELLSKDGGDDTEEVGLDEMLHNLQNDELINTESQKIVAEEVAGEMDVEIAENTEEMNIDDMLNDLNDKP